MKPTEPAGQQSFTLTEDELNQLVELVQRTCVALAVERHTDALADGLCAEGAWDCAMDAIRSQSPAGLLQSFLGDQISKR